jgi:hypothetical protein
VSCILIIRPDKRSISAVGAPEQELESDVPICPNDGGSGSAKALELSTFKLIS